MKMPLSDKDVPDPKDISDLFDPEPRYKLNRDPQKTKERDQRTNKKEWQNFKETRASFNEAASHWEEGQEREIFKLAQLDCTIEEIARYLNCSIEMVAERHAEALHAGWANGQRSLRRQMHKMALNGDGRMAVWLSKQRCGYKDQIQTDNNNNVSFNITVIDNP